MVRVGSNGSTATMDSKKNSKMTEKDAIMLMGLKAEHSSNLVINPDRNKFVSKWDTITTTALIFVAIVTPVEVGLMEIKLDPLFWVNRVIDVIFLVDMVFQFFLMYPVHTRYGRRLEHRHRKIVRHYVCGWFSVDLMSVIPLDVIGVLMESDGLRRAKVVKVIRLLRLLKLTRALRASRLLRKAEVNLSITYQRLNLVKFFVMLGIASHWQACLWAMTLQLVDGDANTPRWIDGIAAAEEAVGMAEKTVNTTWKLYITSAYFASYTMTSVGYGDIVPRNSMERCVCLVLLFWAGITWAYIIGQVSHIVGAMDAHEQRFRQTMDDLNFMMQDRNLPHPMRRRLRAFFLYNKDVQRYSQHRKLLEKMSPALQGEVALIANAIWIEKVSFLSEFVKGLDVDASGKLRKGAGTTGLSSAPAFVVDIAMALETYTYAQEEQFGKPSTLFVLNRGLAGRKMKVVRSGAVWGEDFVLKDSTLQHTTSSWALTYVEVSTLDRSTFMDIVNAHKHVHWKLHQRVRRFCVRLAAQRGIIREAQKRKLRMMESSGSGITPMKVSCMALGPGEASVPANQFEGGNRHHSRKKTTSNQLAPDSCVSEVGKLREEVSELRASNEESNALLRRLVQALDLDEDAESLLAGCREGMPSQAGSPKPDRSPSVVECRHADVLTDTGDPG